MHGSYLELKNLTWVAQLVSISTFNTCCINRMKTSFFIFLISLLSISRLLAFGEGSVVTSISDDFEDPNWTFDYANNISSNGLWFGGTRGTPTVIQRVTPSPGEAAGNTGALLIKTNDNSGDVFTQDDLITQYYTSTSYGKNIALSDAPSYEISLHYPAISQWKDGHALGFRIGAKDASLVSNNNPSGSYYPSIWLVRQGSKVQIKGRIGDGISPDFVIKAFTPSTAGRIKLGISWDSLGRTKYYVLFGSGTITESNLLKTDTWSGRTMDYLEYHFLSLGYPANSGESPEFTIDYIKIYKYVKIVIPPAASNVLLSNPSFEDLFFNGFIGVPEKTLGDSASLWLPDDYADWAGDNSQVVTAQNGITPLASDSKTKGKRMLKFLNSWVPDGVSGPATQGTVCQVRQLVDMSPYAASVAAGGVKLNLSAYFNRVNVSKATDTQFNVAILAFEGSPDAAPTLINGFAQLAQSQASILTDSYLKSWQKASTGLILPTNTDFVSVEVHAQENKQNNDDVLAPLDPSVFLGNEFDGHYADLISLTISGN